MIPRAPRCSRRLVAGVALLLAAAVAGAVGTIAASDPFLPSEAILARPSNSHPLGTDELGRDVLTRVLHGAVTALSIAIPPVLVAALVGVSIGLAAGYYGGLLDELLLKLIELVLVVPRFLIALVVVALFGGELWLVGVVLALTFWPHTARVARGEVISLRERPFVEAATALGGSTGWIMTRHLLPLLMPVVAVVTSFQASQAVLIESGLAFLGLGDRDVVSWGAMLADAQSYLGAAWWTSVFPGAALALTILALNLLGDGLADSWSIRGASRT